MPLKTAKRLFAEQLIKKNSKKADRELARLLYNSQFKKEFTDYEHARSTIRQIKGHMGERQKNNLSDKSLITPASHSKTYIATKEPKQYKDATKRKLNKSKYYLITWAQNNTPIHKEFWANLQAYSKFLGAEIHVILGRYKNTNSLQGINDEEFWDKEVLPYADAHRHHLHKHLELLSDIKTQPTAATPLIGLEGISGLNSCVIGHPKVQFKVIPALEGYEPKMMFSTGALTKRNYTDSSAGKKGEFHHTFGAVIVEIKDKEIFFIRQITALKNGNFSDLCHEVKDGNVSKVNKIDIAVLGDTHVNDHCDKVTSRQKEWLKVFKPKYTVLHDIFNGNSINHHEEKDPIKQYEREQNNSNNLQKEINEMLDWLKCMLPFNPVIVSSNHNDFIDKHIKNNDWKRSIKNAKTYIECANILLSGKAKKGLIAYFIDERFGNKVKTLGRDESFKHNDWELAQHFDLGSNGSRGGISQFRKLSTKMIGGHSHSPSRTDGVLFVGTSTKLRVGYNISASSWMNCDVIVHPNGKAQHLIYLGKEKEFTTFKIQ